MRTKRDRGYIADALALASVWLMAVAALPPEARAATPPNIVVIMTDDQWYDSVNYMPKTLSMIAASGVTFTNFHVSNPICGPSRSTYFTGQYSHNHGVESNGGTNGGLGPFDDSSTLATWLKAAGYHTSLIGKYLNGYGYGAGATSIPPGWDNWHASLPDTELLYDYALNQNGTVVNYGSDPEDFKTDVLAALALENIHARAGNGPFFMSVNVSAPHLEYPGDTQSVRAAPRHEGMFAGLTFPIKTSFNEANVSDKPLWIRNLFSLNLKTRNEIAQSWRDKLEGLQSVDDLVEAVMNALNEEGILNDTVVIFTSDNGVMQGEHRIAGGKNRLYEEASRMPLMIRGGGFTAGSVRTQVVGNIDLASTITSYAGTVPTITQDGISLRPYATNANYRPNRAMLLENDPLAANSFNAIATKRWVYARLSTGEEELYNIKTDPLQLTSYHALAKQAATKAALGALLDQLESCAGASCQVIYSN
jgi:N-acetylglucosamine-6-sulfatase